MSTNSPTRLRQSAAAWPVAFAVALVAAYCLISAVTLFPIPNVDSHLFVGTAIRYAQGHGLTHPAYDFRHLDLTGQNRVVTYPPLFFWLIGAMMPRADARWAFGLIAAFRILQVALWGWIFTKVPGFRAGSGGSRRWWLIAICLVAIVSEAGGPMEGRPEALVALIHAIVVALLLRLPQRWHPAILGVALGLIGSAHPVAAIMTAGAIAMYVGTRWAKMAAIVQLSGICLLSLVVFSAVVGLGPNGLSATIAGASAVVDKIIIPAWGSLRMFFFWAGRTPFAGVLIAAAFGGLLVLANRNRTSLASPLVAVAGAVVFWWAAWYFSIRAPARIYNVMAFTPFFFAVIVWAASGAPATRLAQKIPWVIASACCAGFVRYVVLIAFFLRSGVPYDRARRVLQQEVAGEPRGRVSISYDAMFLLDDYDRMTLNNSLDAALRHHPTYIVSLGVPAAPDVDRLSAAGYRMHVLLAEPDMPRSLPRWAAGYRLTAFSTDSSAR